MQSRLIAKQHQCLILQPCLVEKLGRTPSIFLQQLHYWITSEKNVGKFFQEKKWVYNSTKSWALQLCLSERQVSRVINHLKELGIILVDQLSQLKSDRTNWYTINYPVLESILPNLSLKSKEVNHPLEKGNYSSDWNTDKMSTSPRHSDRVYNKETETTSENKTISSEGVDFRKQTECSQQVNFVKEEINLKNKNNLAAELLEIWNQTAGQGGTLAHLTKKRAQHLVAAFKYRFESNLEKWKHFCQQITTSDFLMGKVKETFRASLDWVLRFDIIQRIIEGDFGIKLKDFIQGIPATEESFEAISREIDSSDDSVEVKALRKKILHQFGEGTYQSWFKNLRIVIEEQGRRIKLEARSVFERDYLETHYLRDLCSLASKDIHIFCRQLRKES
jgi:hypothetical protein